jgi:hypothetical protein
MKKATIIIIDDKEITISELKVKDALALFADENNMLGKFLSGDIEATKHMFALSTNNTTSDEIAECMESANNFVVIHQAIMELNKSFFVGYPLMIQGMLDMVKSIKIPESQGVS